MSSSASKSAGSSRSGNRTRRRALRNQKIAATSARGRRLISISDGRCADSRAGTASARHLPSRGRGSNAAGRATLSASATLCVNSSHDTTDSMAANVSEHEGDEGRMAADGLEIPQVLDAHFALLRVPTRRGAPDEATDRDQAAAQLPGAASAGVNVVASHPASSSGGWHKPGQHDRSRCREWGEQRIEPIGGMTIRSDLRRSISCSASAILAAIGLLQLDHHVVHLPLDAFAVRDIAHDAREVAAATESEFTHRQIEWKCGSVLATPLDLPADADDLRLGLLPIWMTPPLA